MKKEYKVHSLYMAAYLRWVGFEPIRIEPVDKNKKVFVYDDEVELRNCVEDFNADEYLQNYIKCHSSMRRDMNAKAT